MGAKQTWDSLPGWAKGTLAIAGAAATVLTVYAVYRGTKNFIASKNARQEITDVTNEIKTLPKKATLTPSQLSGLANQLHTAFDGYGTSYSGVIKAMVYMNNDADVLSLIKEYGVREISSGKWNPTPNFKGTLGQTIADELADDERSAVNTTLANKGIKYRF